MDKTEAVCDECGSPFRRDASAMEGLCAACAHALYGYPACPHTFENGRCTHCGWNGATSPYLDGQSRGSVTGSQ